MSSTENWARVLSAVAVTIGLVLVIWELQQTRTLARAQLLHDSFTDSYHYFLTRMGENSSEVHVKACLNPQEMSNAEIAVNFADSETLWLEMRRFILLESIANFGGDIDAYLEAAMSLYLGRPLGWHKYETTRETWPPILKKAAERVIEKDLVIPCEKQLQGFIDVFRQNKKTTLQ